MPEAYILQVYRFARDRVHLGRLARDSSIVASLGAQRPGIGLLRFGFAPVSILVNHGAEDPDDHPAAKHWADALEPLRLRLSVRKRGLRLAGVIVGDKGQSIALHHRQAASTAAALKTIDGVLTRCRKQVLRHAAARMSSRWSPPMRPTRLSRCACRSGAWDAARHSSRATTPMTSRFSRPRLTTGSPPRPTPRDPARGRGPAARWLRKFEPTELPELQEGKDNPERP